MEFFGAFLLGVLLGWFVYYINRYRTTGVQLSDLTTLISVVGTASATLFFSKSNGPNLLFAGFCFGLFVGFFGYLAWLIGLVLSSKNFTFDWFLDGRRMAPQPPFYIPDGTAVTVRPAFAAAISQPIVGAMSPHPSSFRSAPAAQRLRDVDPSGIVHLTIILKPSVPVLPAAYALGKGLSLSAYRAKHGTDQTVLDAVSTFARSYGLTVHSADSASHTVDIVGTYSQAQAAFRPDDIGVYSYADGKEYTARSGHIWLPDAFADKVVAVMGFDQRPAARPHSRIKPADAALLASAFDPTQVAQKYGFPVDVNGNGQTVALIELGGGFDPTDVAAYFQQKSISRAGSLIAVPVDGGANTPGQDTHSDGEVQLDIDIVGSIAPGSNLRVYFAPNSDASFYRAIQAAIADGVNIISISWGHAETTWVAQDMIAMDQLFQTATAQNISVCVASGDNGSVDQSPDGSNVADFPASSPNVLGCGGTSFGQNGEVAWNDGEGASGGGFSTQFARPNYQTSGRGSWRGVPDVAGDADPETGYNIRVNGNPMVSGGTSAVAPLWAGLIALANQKLAKNVGFVNPALYANPASFNDITVGSNGGYTAGPGWDAVTGLGSPRGNIVVSTLGR